VAHVLAAARVEIIDAEYLVPFRDQTVAQVRADEARSAGDEDPLRLGGIAIHFGREDDG